MDIDQVEATFVSSLSRHQPFFDNLVERPQGLLRVRGYAQTVVVPDVLISAARAVVFKDSRVIVLRESDGVRHVMPGGRRRPGEAPDDTVRRELLEECGWHVGELRPFAFLHFQHPEPPVDWSDFVNVLFIADAIRYERRARDPTQGDVRSRLTPIGVAVGMLAERHQAILQVAVACRAK